MISDVLMAHTEHQPAWDRAAQACTISRLQVPGVYDAFGTNRSALLEWPLDEQIVWHHAAVQSQMEQLYYGLAIAAALNRTIILPQVSSAFQVTAMETVISSFHGGDHDLRVSLPHRGAHEGCVIACAAPTKTVSLAGTEELSLTVTPGSGRCQRSSCCRHATAGSGACARQP